MKSRESHQSYDSHLRQRLIIPTATAKYSVTIAKIVVCLLHLDDGVFVVAVNKY